MHVYFVCAAFGEEKYLKIGKANSPKQRLTELQVGCPSRLELIDVVDCVNQAQARRLERLAHKLFKPHRRQGEWFSLPPDWRAMIASVREMADKIKPPPEHPNEEKVKWITLDAWGEAAYSPSPHRRTLARWARLGLIQPAPRKFGRSYYVTPNARYVAKGKSSA